MTTSLRPQLSPLMIEDLVRNALLEDLGRAGDITTYATIGPEKTATAELNSREQGVVAGGLLFQGVQSLMGHHKPSTESNTASPLSNAQEESLPGLVSPQASADDALDTGDSSWDAGEDWA